MTYCPRVLDFAIWPIKAMLRLCRHSMRVRILKIKLRDDDELNFIEEVLDIWIIQGESTAYLSDLWVLLFELGLKYFQVSFDHVKLIFHHLHHCIAIDNFSTIWLKIRFEFIKYYTLFFLITFL